MAKTAQGNRLTATYRQSQQALRAATLRDLLRLWPALDWNDLARTYPGWLAAVSAVIQRDHTTSTRLAAAYLQAFRSVEIRGRPVPAVLAEALPRGQVETSMRVTSQVAFKRGRAAGQSVEQAARNAYVLMSGAATRLVLTGGNDTITDTLATDPRAGGWSRVVSSSGCDFCAMLADRGAVYSADTADFGAHDHCSCSAEPAYDVELRSVKAYAPSLRGTSAADQRRARQWIRDNAARLERPPAG